MSGFLVDTNVVSEFIRPQPDPRVIRWLEAADPESLFASVVTFGEIRLGIEDLPSNWFESHLLQLTKAIADRCHRSEKERNVDHYSLIRPSSRQ